MAENFLHGEYLGMFMQALAELGELHAPLLSDDGVTGYRPLKGMEEFRFDVRRTLIPPKKFLIPPREEVLSFTATGCYQQANPAPPPIILFAIPPCDLAGIAYLDKIFMNAPSDPHYVQRRAALTLIGISCEPDEFCFCGEPGSCRAENCDLFLTRADPGFIVTPHTDRGKEIFAAVATFLTATTSKTAGNEINWASPFTLPIAPERHAESPLWDKFATACLACGACSVCCPTCYCFDVREHGSLDGCTAVRKREWDNCLFADHGTVAGGHNFRETRRERLWYRFLHKYCGFTPFQGEVSCVGCGRCAAVCPVGIDLRKILETPEQS